MSTSLHTRPPIVAYATIGCPTLEASLNWIRKLILGGANTIELGVPSKNPFADGTVIQKAHHTAHQNGATLTHVFEIAKIIKEEFPSTKLVLCTYLKEIQDFGLEKSCRAMCHAGIETTIFIDANIDEIQQMIPCLQTYHQRWIPLIPFDTPMAKFQAILTLPQIDSVYAITTRGPTGTPLFDIENVAQRISNRAEKCPYPMWAGFGISSVHAGRPFLEKNIGIVIGTALVRHQIENDTHRIQEILG